LTEYAFNNDGKKVKIVRTFKVEKKLVAQSIAQRKKWKKFGMSSNDRPGPGKNKGSFNFVLGKFSTEVKKLVRFEN